MTERIIITAPREGVAVGGRFDGWRMRQHPDGQWVSVAKLEAVSPFSEVGGVLGALFADHQSKSVAPTLAPVQDVAGLVGHLREGAADLTPYCAGAAKEPMINCALPAFLNDAADALEALQAEVERRTRIASRATAAEAEVATLRAEVERAAEARDNAGYLGTVSDCISHLAADLTQAERDIKRKDNALRCADQFITNGIEFGFIRMPDASTPDPARETPGIIRSALGKAGSPADTKAEPESPMAVIARSMRDGTARFVSAPKPDAED